MTNALLSDFQNGAGEYAPEPQIESYRLKQTGGRPRDISGVELCSAMSFVVGTPLWYEINVYRTVDRGFVVEVKMFTKGENERDMFRLFDAATPADVIETLETYEPSFDIDASSVRFGVEEISVAELSLSAAALRLRIEEARRQFNDLVGEILFQLDNA